MSPGGAMWWTATWLATPGWTQISRSSLVRQRDRDQTVAEGSQKQLVLILQAELCGDSHITKHRGRDIQKMDQDQAMANLA